MASRTSNSTSTWFPRTLGVATAAYSVAIIVSPALLAKPSGLADDGGDVPSGTAITIRALGGRDLASGLAMVLAPAGTPLRTAIGVRVGSDVVDLVLLGTSLPDPAARKKAAGAAAAWGALCALSARWAGSR